MGNSDAILKIRLQILGARRGCEMGRVSLFLSGRLVGKLPNSP